MTQTVLIIAAHGSRRDTSANDIVRACVAQLADMDDLRFDMVTAAFHQGEPTFSQVLDGLSIDTRGPELSPAVTVLPLMTSRGYYCDVVLPRELARNHCHSRMNLRITDPVGAHPFIVELIAARVRTMLQRFELSPPDTTLVLVGHGTLRHPQSFELTDRVAKDLASRSTCGQVLAAYLDESPSVESAVALATGRNVIVVPFLIGGGTHATRDLPRRLGIDAAECHRAPFASRANGRFVACDAPIGTDPGIVDVLADLATSRSTLDRSRETQELTEVR